MNPDQEEIKQQLFDGLPFEVIWLGEEGEFLYANARFCERMGYGKAELEELTIFDINPASSPESWRQHWETVARDGREFFKGMHRTKDGLFREVEVNAQFFSNGRKNAISAVITDIAQSNFYRNLLLQTERISGTGGWKLNLQDDTFIVTDEALCIFDTEDRAQLHPDRVHAFFQDPEVLKDALAELRHQGKPFEVTLPTRHEPRRFIRANGEPWGPDGQTYKMFGTYQDVTEEFERANSLRLYQQIIDNAEDLVYLYNRAGKLLLYSDSVVRKLGFSEAELNAFSIFDLDSTITPEWWAGHFEEIVQSGSLRFEWLVARKDGTKFPVDITANYLQVGGIDLNCAIIRDVTERKMRDLKLFEALEEIKALKERIESENEYLQEAIQKALNAGNIIYKSAAYEKIMGQVQQVAPTDSTVLITGETGTGKELLANAVHDNSPRHKRPLIKVNCATLPAELIESELFGHRKGAFTGAIADKAGKFQLADGGTIFLDEIGELPLDLQPKLLRVLQEGEYEEIGGTRAKKIDVRVVAASNRDLEAMMHAGKFRADLFYRLNVFPIHNVPLRERKEDVSLLAQYFLDKYATKIGKSFKRLAKRAVDGLMAYSFPGNIRELENLIERAVITEQGPVLHPGDWIPKGRAEDPGTGDFVSLDQMQRQYIIDVLEYTGWRVSGPKGAARILDMNPKTLFARMKKLGIEKKTVLKESE